MYINQYMTQFTFLFPHSLMYKPPVVAFSSIYGYLQWLFQQFMDLSVVNRSVRLIKLVQKANFSYKLFVLSIYGIYPSFHQMRVV